MTVRELIDRLEKIKDQSRRVMVWDSFHDEETDRVIVTDRGDHVLISNWETWKSNEPTGKR